MINTKRTVVVVTLMIIQTGMQLGLITSTVSGQQTPENNVIIKPIDVTGIDDYFERVVDKSKAIILECGVLLDCKIDRMLNFDQFLNIEQFL